MIGALSDEPFCAAVTLALRRYSLMSSSLELDETLDDSSIFLLASMIGVGVLRTEMSFSVSMR